jgi:peptide/nickel transport system permease protein
MYGARTALLVSFPAALLAALLGTTLGIAAGYWGNTGLRLPLAWVLAAAGAGITYGLVRAPEASPLAGWWPVLVGSSATLAGIGLLRLQRLRQPVALPVNTLVSVAIILLAALPRLLLVVVVAAATEPGTSTLIGLLTLTFWPSSAMLIRAEARRIRQLPYLEAALALGLPIRNIIFRHVLPNSWRVIRTSLPMSLAVLIGLETTLSFLGVGLPPEVPSWGRLLAASRLAPSSWWLIVFPASALLFTALALRQLLPSDDVRRT